MGENNFNKFDFSKLDLCHSTVQNRMQETMNSMYREQQKKFKAIEAAKRAKEDEELRRHNELVNALKEAGEKGATIVIGDNAKGIQIQQNSAGASQYMCDSQALDYEKTYSILDEIKGYFEYPQFEQTFGKNTESIKQIVVNTMQAIQKHEDEGLIKKSLHVLKDLAVGVTGSMIASGILALLGQLPI